MPNNELDLDYFKEKLIKLRDELMAFEEIASKDADTVELDQSRIGRLSRMDALQAQAMSIETNRMRSLRIEQADSALERIEAGDFGLCIKCGKDIDHGRLDFNPVSLKCIKCAE
ncbi:MAG: hypothetical protein KAS64_10400 [Spirochaetes bacterium]|nr:hypothetical protein [Spirochaetota bacterium]